MQSRTHCGPILSIQSIGRFILIALSTSLISCASDPTRDAIYVADKEEANRANAALNEPGIEWNNADKFTQNWNIPQPRFESFTAVPTQLGSDKVVALSAKSASTNFLLNGLLTLQGQYEFNNLGPDLYPSVYCLQKGCGSQARACAKYSLKRASPTLDSPDNLDFDILCYYPEKFGALNIEGGLISISFDKSSNALKVNLNNGSAPYLYESLISGFYFNENINWFIPEGWKLIDYRLDGDSESFVEKKIRALTPEKRQQAQTIFENAFSIYQAGDFAAARIRFDQGLDIDPSSAKANFYMAETLKRLSYNAIAGYYYLQTIKFAPDSTEAAKAHAALGN